MTTVEALFRRMEAAGIELMIHSSDTIPCTYEDAIEFIEDPDKYLAAREGVDLGSYIAWRTHEPICCSAMTRKRRRCRVWIVSVCAYLTVQEYARLRSAGGYCHIHAGGQP